MHTAYLLYQAQHAYLHHKHCISSASIARITMLHTYLIDHVLGKFLASIAAQIISLENTEHKKLRRLVPASPYIAVTDLGLSATIPRRGQHPVNDRQWEKNASLYVHVRAGEADVRTGNHENFFETHPDARSRNEILQTCQSKG